MMKASRRNPANILVVAILSVGALSCGLLSLGRFDLISEPFGSLLVLSRAVSSVAALGVLSLWTVRKNPQLKLGYVRVRE
jgi:uncharacterized membrane protein YuzA (DUF378 family)